MDFNQTIIAILLCVIVILEVLHQLQLNKLVNKLMSRNYYDYKVSQSVTNIEQTQKEPKVQVEEVEDFAHMSDYINNVT